jgi:hypothetical protein
MKLAAILLVSQGLLCEAFVCPKTNFASNQVRNAIPTFPSSSSLGAFGDLKGFTAFFKPKTAEPVPIEPKFETVVIDPDFRIAALFLVTGVGLDLIPYIQLTLGPFITLLGALFLFQANRIRFLFDETALELVTVGKTDDLQSSGENVIVGGANRWETKTIVNYDFFPKGWIDGPVGPILVYFKETETPSDKWDEGPGKLANDPDKIASGEAKAGQGTFCCLAVLFRIHLVHSFIHVVYTQFISFQLFAMLNRSETSLRREGAERFS